MAKKYMNERLSTCDFATLAMGVIAILEAMLGAACRATYTVRNGSATAKKSGTPIIGP